jgi:hypothetical protein
MASKAAVARKRPWIGFKTITPAEARAMLEQSKRRNRQVSSVKVEEYAKKMEDKRWNPHNSTAISRDWNGDLVNGHNRLYACVKANVPFETAFMDGVNPEAFKDEDTGKPRTALDYFMIEGVANRFEAGITAAAARSLLMWERGLWRYAASSKSVRHMPETIVSHEQLMEEVNRRPLLRKAVALMYGKRNVIKGRYPMGLLAAFWTLTHGHPRHDAFWSELIDGLEIAPTSPVRPLRQRVEASLAQSHRIGVVYFCALMTKAWNAYAADQKAQRLFWMQNRGEAFPEPTTRLKPQLAPRPDVPAAAPEKKAA